MGKIFRLPHENEIRRAERKTLAGFKLAREEFPRWHVDVIEDVNDIVEMSREIRVKNGDKVLGMFIHGGVVRRPDISHKDSDVDVLIVKEDGSGWEAVRPGDFRISLLIYPYRYLTWQLTQPTEEGSFLRNVFSQAKLKVIDNQVLDELERTAEENYQVQDILRLVYHHLKKGRDRKEYRGIGDILDEVGLVDDEIFPYAIDEPTGYYEKKGKVYYLAGCSLSDEFVWAYPIKHDWEMVFLPGNRELGSRLDRADRYMRKR